MAELNVEVFASAAQLDQKLAANVANLLEHAVAERGRATLVVSGGSTPVNFFRTLSRAEIPWAQVSVTLADERWVSGEDDDSNEKLVRENLLVNRAREASFIPLKREYDTPAQAEDELNQALEALGTFDVVILGMGGDGHTASLFPKAVNLAAGLDMHSGKSCLAVDPVTAPHLRMSMTLPRLLDARQIIIHITGQKKKAIFDRAQAEGDSLSLPISAFIKQSISPVTLCWSE